MNLDLTQALALLKENGITMKGPEQPIGEICQAYNLPLAKVLAGLQDAGFTAQADDTVKAVSSSKGGNPMEVFEIIKEIAP